MGTHKFRFGRADHPDELDTSRYGYAEPASDLIDKQLELLSSIRRSNYKADPELVIMNGRTLLHLSYGIYPLITRIRNLPIQVVNRLPNGYAFVVTKREEKKRGKKNSQVD